MPNLFDDGPDDEAFALPGDEERLAAIRGARDDAPAPAAAEPEAPAQPEPAAAEAPEPEAPAAPAATEPTAEEQATAAALGVEVDDPQVQDYLGKYDGDVSKALKAAAEAQSLIGRQGQELGELRQLVEERLATVEERQLAEAQPQYDTDALETWFADNPTQIPAVAANAYHAGNEQLLDAAIAAWEDVDKPGARRFERQIAVAEARRELHADTAQSEQLVSEWHTVAQEFSEAHPDLEQLAPKMRELAPQYPHLIQVLRTGDPQSKREVLDFIYEKARGHNSDTLVTARAIAREQAQEADQAIREAAVASGAAATPAAGLSPAEAIAAEWDKVDAPYRDGWNV